MNRRLLVALNSAIEEGSVDWATVLMGIGITHGSSLHAAPAHCSARRRVPAFASLGHRETRRRRSDRYPTLPRY